MRPSGPPPALFATSMVRVTSKSTYPWYRNLYQYGGLLAGSARTILHSGYRLGGCVLPLGCAVSRSIIPQSQYYTLWFIIGFAGDREAFLCSVRPACHTSANPERLLVHVWRSLYLRNTCRMKCRSWTDMVVLVLQLHVKLCFTGDGHAMQLILAFCFCFFDHTL